MKAFLPAAACLLLLGSSSCKKTSSTNSNAKLHFSFRFDSTQVRLNNFGNPVTVPAGHGAQSPRFNKMSAHYVELTTDALTPLGNGVVLYRAPEVTTGGSLAIDFSKAAFAGNNETFLSLPLSQLPAGTYRYLRVSLAYQNYNIYLGIPGRVVDATLASFIGFNTYIGSYPIKDSIVTVNANRKQGYWGLETSIAGFGLVRTGQAPEGATTVPNPLFATSAVPAGSCVVTGAFATPLVITGSETGDVNIRVSLSTNKSFEWTETDGNNIYDPLPPNNEQVVDMGIRGMIPARL